MKSEASVQKATRIWWLPWMQKQEALDIWLSLLEKADVFLPHPDEEAAICASCSGICCDAISYIIPGGHRGEDNQGRPDMDFTHMEMLALGANFRWDLGITGHTPCLHHDPRIGCRQWEDRPALCRSYYCRGEHWIPKEV
jgi:hypothetical protein